jgi:tetratricopeptide (TPR) repeat protein
MKRTLTLIAGAVLIASLAACGPKNGGKTKHGGDMVEGPGGAVTQELSEKAKEVYQAAMDAFEQHDKAGDWSEAVCTDLEDQFRKASKEQASGLVKAIYNVGVVWQKCGDHKKAWAAFDEAQDLDKKQNKGQETYPPPIIQKGTYKFKLYLNDGKGADLTQAKSLLEQAIKVGQGLDPSLVEAYVNLAHIQRLEAKGNKKMHEEALKNLQRALVIDSKSMDAFLQMAELYRDMASGEKDDSKLDLSTLVITQGQLIETEKGVSFPAFNLTLGLMKMERGDIIGALKNFKAAYEKDGDLFEAYMNYGAITIGFRGYEDAEMVFTKALELKPDNYSAHLNLGVAKRGLEKYEEAEAEYKKAMDLNPTAPDAYFNMGLLYQDYRLDMAGASGYENFEVAIDWYKKFKGRAGSKAEYEDKVKEADQRIKNCEQAIALMKEAASMMAETEKLMKEAEAEEKAAAEAAAKAAKDEAKAAEAADKAAGDEAKAAETGGAKPAEGGGEAKKEDKKKDE